MNDTKLLNYIHFADSAWPVGSFAYSSGLEAMTKFGQLGSISDLERYLDSSLDQWLHFDIQILYSLFSEKEFVEAMELYHISTRTPSIRKAAETQGRTWMRLLEVTHREVDIEEIKTLFRQHQIKPYFIGVYALVMKALNYNVEETSDLYLYTLQRDQISAAIRLGLLGPSSAHAMLSHSLKKISYKYNKTKTYHYTQAMRILPVSDVAQIAHANLYSKLFRN